jgi:uncharacterized protein DUF6551
VAGKAVDVEQLQATSKIRKVNLSELQVDRTYQRDPSMNLVDEIANNWDEVASELLLVSDRGERQGGDVEGGLWIVNGQHRSLAARKRGIKSVDARIIDLSDLEDPAAVEAVFRLRTNVRMPDKSLERFKAQLRSGNPESVAIEKLLAGFDTEINISGFSQDGGINAVTTIEKLYRADEGVLLTEVLTLIRETYGAFAGRAASAPVLTALAWFVVKHGDEADRGRLISQLKSVGLEALDRRGRTIASTMGGTLWMNYYRAVVDFYNDRLRDSSKLEWKMRGASTFKGTASTSRGAFSTD